jgi:hypothetical protein
LSRPLEHLPQPVPSMHKSAYTVGSRMRTYGTVRSIGSICRCSLWVQYGNSYGIGQA